MDQEVRQLLRRGKDLGLNPRITSSYRNRQQQRLLSEESMAGRNLYPVALPGESLHEYGLEVDIVSNDNAALGRLWMAMGHRFGGQRDAVAFVF